MKALAAIFGLFLALSAEAAFPATGLTAALTERLVQISTGFSGVHVTLFGAIDGGGDIVVTVRGPNRNVTVREKRDVAGVWLNRQSVRFGMVPAYYAVLATKPLSDILPAAKLIENEIGFDAIKLQAAAGASPDDQAEFHQALIRSLTEKGLYQAPSSTIELLDGRLFRSVLDLPATVPVGAYAVSVFLVRHGAIVATETLPLVVAETGAEAAMRAVANGDPLFYGLMAVFAAASVGWLGNVVLRSSQ